MAVTVTRTSTLFTDSDSDGVVDPGDIVLVHILVSNTNATDILNLKVYDSQNGLTIDPGTVKVTPIAFDDHSPGAPLTIVGNTPYIVTASALLANDVDPDGAEAGLTIASFTNLNHVSVNVLPGGEYQIVPETGYQGVASFDYFITDAQGLTSVSTGRVHILVSGQIWYVDSAAAAGGDGSYLKPFTDLSKLNDDGTVGPGTVGPSDNVKGDDDVDGVGDTIFVYDRGGSYTGGITLENNQKLYGDGFDTLVVNNLSIGASSANTVINHSSYGVTLATGNTVAGLDLTGTGTTVAIRDGGTGVGNLTISDVALSGSGQAVDIDQGGSLTVSLNSVSSTGSNGPVDAQGTSGAIDLAGTSGTFTVTGATSITGAHAGGGIDITASSSLTASFQGAVTVNTGAQTAINFASGNNNSVLNLTGSSKDIDTTTGTALNFSGNPNSSVNITGGGLDVDTTGGTGLSFTNTTVTITGDGNSIATATGGIISGSGAIGVGGLDFDSLTATGTTNGSAILLSGVTGGALNSDSTTIASSVNHGVSITTGTTSNVTLGSGSIGGSTSTSGRNVSIDGGTGSFDYNGTLNRTTDGNVIEVKNKTGGTVQFDGAVNVSGGGDGILLTNNTGATINFTNNLTLNTSASGTTAFSAVGGGTVSASHASSTISSGTGTALNVVNTNIGAADLNFLSVNVNGAATGIVLNNTGSTGGLTITGTGATNATGGTIQNTTGRGIDIQNAVQIKISNVTLTSAGTSDLDSSNQDLSIGDNLATNAAINLVNVTNVTLDNVDITGGAEQGINGNNVANFNLLNSTITNVGDDPDEDNIHFYNMSGTSSIVNTVLTHNSGGGDDNLNLQMGSGNLDLTITGGSAVGINGGVQHLGSGYLFGIRGTSTANINIDGATVTNHFSGGIVADVFDSATMNLRVNNSNVSGNNDQISVSAGDNSKVDLEITNNVIGATQAEDKVGIGLLGSAFDNGFVFDARIHNNQITVANGITGDGIIVNNAGGGVMNVAITNNPILYGGTQRAINIQTGQDGAGVLRATVTGNNINMTAATHGNPAILAQSAVTHPTGEGAALDLNIGGAGALANTFTHSGGATIAGGDIRVRQRFDGSVNLDGYSGTAFDDAAVINYLNARNNEVNPATATSDAGGGLGGASDGAGPGWTGAASPGYIVVTVSAASVAEDGATNLVYTFTRSGNIAGGLAASFSITGTATAGSDFTVSGATSFSNATGNGTITFAAGSATATITVDPTADAAAEADESIVVDVGNSATANGGFARAVITNNDGTVFMQMAEAAPPAPASVTAPQTRAAGLEAIRQAQLALESAKGSGQAPGGGNSGPPAPPAVSGGVPAPVVDADGRISDAELDLLVAAAIDRWAANGATADQIAAMKAVKVGLADMMGLQIGSAGAGFIKIDEDAAGRGWFVDPTPGDDSEYAGSGTRLLAASGPAAGRVDLLTVLIHELGHQIGLEDDYSSAAGVDAMYGYMGVGERRLPAAGDAARADGHAPTNEAFLLSPVADIGTLPAGKSVDVQFQATVNSYFNQVIAPLSNTATADYSGTSTNSNTNVTAIDTLTLGDRVFVDANNNNVFDAGEGRNGVALTLFADTNNNGLLDIGTDVQLLTTTTAGAGAAAGTYSFANLSQGNYIVRVDASNFAGGGALAGTRGVFGGVDPDGDAVGGFNVDNDDNGIAGPAGSVVAAPISLVYNTEPTSDGGAIPKNDINNTLDFGFVVNTAPVANADSLSTAEDTPAQYSTELTGNDTDADLDTLTITGVSNFVNGTASLAGGIVTFTPTANFNGTASFDYTISDGNGHTATATATVAVGAVNDPIGTVAPGAVALNEDSVDFAVTGMSITDDDAALAPSGLYEIVLSATQGTLKLSTITGLSFSSGDGDGDTTMTFSGTLADINTALATAKYTPNANYAGAAQISFQATDEVGGTVATGTGVATADGNTINVTVNPVNDAPLGANQSSAATEGVEYVFSASDFSENFSDPVEGNSFAGIRITSLPATGTLKLNGVAVTAPTDVTATQLADGDLTYLPAAGSAGTSPTFKFRVQDNGGTANGGQDFAIAENVYTISVAVANAAPVLDLDANGAGSGFASSYTEGAAAAAIGDTDVSITDADGADDIVRATITITNPEAGDVLNVGSLPAGVTHDLANSTATTVVLTAAPGTLASAFEAAIEAITFENTGDDPTDKGTNLSRSISVVVNDGTADSNTATATVAVTDLNDAPTGITSTITALEDAHRTLSAGDFGTDTDGIISSVTISSVSGGGIYYDADGSGNVSTPELRTLPETYSAQDLADGKVSFKANANENGNGLGSIVFTVADDDGASAASSNTLTVNVTAQNDTPVITDSSPVNATEQVPIAILTGVTVSDVDLDSKNGGLGDYSGAKFSVNRNSATNAEDKFTLVAGPSFTIDGNALKTLGGQTFATISVDGSAGLIVIDFTSSHATSALVDEVVQSVRYTNSSDNPPASVDLAAGLVDGSPGGGQGGGSNIAVAVEVVTVNIAPVNDAPVFTAPPTFALQRLSGPGGTEANGGHEGPIFSPDGTKIVFNSSATNLVANDTNGLDDVFVWDLVSGTITRISTDSAGGEANGESGGHLFSADGTKILFRSEATNLGFGGGNQDQLYIKNLITGEVTHVTALDTDDPAWSPDGNLVAFTSPASNPGDTDGDYDVFVKNLTTGTVTRISTDSSGNAADSDSGEAVFSPDGTKIAFASRASNLVAGDSNTVGDIFIKDLTTGAVTRISTDSAGAEGNAESYGGIFSPDGTKFAFSSMAGNLVTGDNNGTADIFVKDLITGAVTRVSTSSSGGEGDGPSFDMSFSPDGTKLVFMSMATNLVTGDTNGHIDIFVKDLVTGEIDRLSKNVLGQEANAYNESPSFSPDGKKVVFVSDANNLVTPDTNPGLDIFIATLGALPPAYTEGGVAAQVAPEVNVSDADSPNFAGGSLSVAITAGGSPGDQLSLAQSGTPGTGVEISGSNVSYNGVVVGTLTDNGTSIAILLNGASNAAAVEALSEAIRISSTSDNPGSAIRTVTFTLNDGDGGNDTASFTRQVVFVPVNDAPVAKPDEVSTPENVVGTGSLFADNGSDPDVDPDGDPITVSHVNGVALDSGQPINLASGAILIVNSDGTYSYNPNGKFNTLTDNSSGAVNTSATETFTYTVTGGNTVTVTVKVEGVAGPGDELRGDSADNTINGTPNNDIFVLHQGGNDTANGWGANDLFIFRGAMTSQDKVNGGTGRDQIAIQGHYTGGGALTLGTGVINVESFVLIPGNDTRYGDPGTQTYSYHVTTVNENVDTGQLMTFDGAQLRVGENFTFRGGAETDGAFRVIGGLGTDDFIGGSQSDVFLFNDGAFGASDVVNGGAGAARDQLALRGNYNVLSFGAGQLTSIESLALLSGHDIPQNVAYNYTIIMNDNNLLGGSMTIDAAQLRADESFVFFGQAESDGIFRIAGGAGGDMVLGGKLGDRIKGNGGGDNIYGREGADELHGGADNDRFAYDFTTDSTAAATDTIMDFTTGDVIALDTIDANSNTGAPDAFTFIGSAAFTLGTAGQLRAYEVSGEPGRWFVEADVNGDAVADMVIEVYTTDLQPLDATDFSL